MLKEAGAEYVIIGHSERRRLFGETDETVNRKSIAGARPAAHADRLHRRDARGARGQPRRSPCSIARSSGTRGSDGDQVAALVIAYEPVWAIGTGRNATPEQAGEAHAHIRARLRVVRPAAAEACHIIYGGSVKPDNIKDLIALDGCGRRTGGWRQPGSPGVFPDRDGCREGILADALLSCGTVYVVVCLFLIVSVLLQQGRAGDIASAFGGSSSQTVFGARSGATVLTRRQVATGCSGHARSCSASGRARRRGGRAEAPTPRRS